MMFGAKQLRCLLVSAFAISLVSEVAISQARDPRCAGYPLSGKEVARGLAVTIDNALKSIVTDHGIEIFSSTDKVNFPDGISTIGELWSSYLGKEGYPADFTVRQCIAVDLVALGLDESAATDIVMTSAELNSIENVKAELEKIR
jgi:hypothetical protein